MKSSLQNSVKNVLFSAYIALVTAGVCIGAVEYRERRCVVTAVSSENERVVSETELPPRVALTFDDGPHPAYTKILLDGLRKRGVKATFFLIGKNIEGNEDLIKQMDEDGHLIGNHTWSHVRLTDLSQEKACEELRKTSEAVKNITGKDTEYIRPPFGAWNKGLECDFDMFFVLWSVDPLDWTTENQDQIVEKVVSEAQDDDIILLHDWYKSSVEAALRIVDLLKEKGYEFVTVDKLLLE